MQGLLAHASTHKTLDIYSALRDPNTGDVRLFLEYYLKHHSQMSAKEKEGPFPQFSETFAGCVFSDHRSFNQSEQVPAQEVCSARLGFGCRPSQSLLPHRL